MSIWGNDDPEVRKFKFALGLIVAYLVFAFISWQSVRIAIWGQTATATVVKVSPEPGNFRVPGGEYTVTYRFEDAGTGERRQAYYETKRSPRLVGETFEVVYVSGAEGSSSPASRRGLLMPMIFGAVTLGLIVAFSYWVWDISRDKKKPKKRRTPSRGRTPGLARR
ncbi:MAG: hypothetical protein AAFY08_09230 [Planctomycetota bacterium]